MCIYNIYCIYIYSILSLHTCTPCYLCECGRGKEEGGLGNQIPGPARDRSAKRFKSATNECVFFETACLDSGPPRFPGLGVVEHPFSIPRLLLRSFFCSSQRNRSLRFNIISFLPFENVWNVWYFSSWTSSVILCRNTLHHFRLSFLRHNAELENQKWGRNDDAFCSELTFWRWNPKCSANGALLCPFTQPLHYDIHYK